MVCVFLGNAVRNQAVEGPSQASSTVDDTASGCQLFRRVPEREIERNEGPNITHAYININIDLDVLRRNVNGGPEARSNRMFAILKAQAEMRRTKLRLDFLRVVQHAIELPTGAI